MVLEYLDLISPNIYIKSGLIFIIFFCLSELVVIISRKIVLHITKKTKTEIDDLLVKGTSKPISLILLFIGIRLSLLPLPIRENILNGIESTISSIIIVIITYIAIVVLGILIDSWGRNVAAKTESTVDDQLVPLAHKFTRIVVSLLGLLFILPVWGIQIGPLLASLGIAGIAVAFALQSTLANIFGGASIIADKSVKVGDKIKVDAETMGTVVEVGLRSTKIKTWDNELVTIPNGKLADSKILNFMQPDPSVRIAIDFGVEYGSDTERVKTTVIETLEKTPGVLSDPEPKVAMMAMGEFALQFRVMFWVSNFDAKFDTKALVTEKLYNAFRKANIGIPFPTRTIYMKENK